MRLIDLKSFAVPAEWQARAAAAREELEQKTSDLERLTFIKNHSQLWRELRGQLIKHFGNKCWYTDAPEYVAKLDVEHFRPKAEAVDLSETKREGYWWLAFDLDNLRLCGQIMNREHKKCYFPVLGSFVASSNCRKPWLEKPVFLDPIRPADVELVAYAEDGRMHPKPDAEEVERFRVEKTDEYFGLNAHQPLVEARQRTWQTCFGLIHDYMKSKEMEKRLGWDPVLDTEQDTILRSLRQLIRPSEPFATIAASCLMQSQYRWANRLASQP